MYPVHSGQGAVIRSGGGKYLYTPNEEYKHKGMAEHKADMTSAEPIGRDMFGDADVRW